MLEAVIGVMAIVVSATNKQRVRSTKELKPFPLLEPQNQNAFTENPNAFNTANNVSFTNFLPGNNSRSGRSKKIIIIPKSEGEMVSCELNCQKMLENFSIFKSNFKDNKIIVCTSAHLHPYRHELF